MPTPVKLTTQGILDTGLKPTYIAASADGNMIDNDGRTFVLVKNGSAVEVTVTVDVGQSFYGKTVTDTAIAIPAGEERCIGPFDPRVYNQQGADAGKVKLTYSAVTTVTLAILNL